MSPRLWPSLLLIGLFLSFGVIPVIVREVDLSSQQLVALRVWLAALFLMGILLVKGETAFPKTSGARILTTGVLLPIHWFMFFQAIETTRVLVALVLVFVAAPAMTVAATRVLGEPLPALTAFGVIGGFIGAAIAADPSNGATTEGVLWALGSGLLLAVILLIVKPGATDVGALKFGAWQSVVAAAVTTPWAITAVPNVGGDLPAVLALGLGLTGLSTWLFLIAMPRVPASQLGSIMYLEPMSAVVGAAVVLGENPGARGWLGVALVVGFGVLVTWSNERMARQTVPVAAGL